MPCPYCHKPKTLASKPLNYDTEWDKFKRWMGIKAKRLNKIPPPPKNGTVIHGVISDLHIPFHDREAIGEAIWWFKQQGVSEVWLGGDVADHYSQSRFMQYEVVPIQTEAVEVRKILDLLSTGFHKVNVIAGNHDDREQKYLSSRIPPDLLKWFLSKSFMERITEDMPNVSMMRRTIEGTDLHWITPVGKDAVIAHAETSSNVTLKAVENVRKWLDNWHYTLGIDRPKVIFQAHTHNAGTARVGPQLVCELGCVCKVQAYALEPRLYPKPQCKTATIFTQVYGKTDLNSIKQRYLCLPFHSNTP